MNLMEEKAQGQFEIILLVLLVIVAVTAVALYLKNAASTITDTAQTQAKQNP
ncbi:MAG: hypothetical protein GX950_01295 [Candidatus Diapherotrites archaeon]|uniref:Uncharacterized protein n=1 Tax=Candidatus Iainarchaeum sp. TaxID=3101447 RepID=A0A7K4BZ11_9ARCH|nr:hypothetical protein [Candidatus Diapherotrites archaeon]